MLPLSIFDAVFWDWDGTIVDTFPVITQAVNAARNAYNLKPLTLEEVQNIIGKQGRLDFAQMFGVQEASNAEKEYYKAIQKLSVQEIKLKEGRKELLDKLKQTNTPMAVVSNKRGDLLRAEVEALGLNTYFGVCIGAGDVEEDKPNKVPFEKAAKTLNVSLDKVCYVGDAPVDHLAAVNAGMKTVLLLAGETHSGNDLNDILTFGRVVKFKELSYLLNIE